MKFEFSINLAETKKLMLFHFLKYIQPTHYFQLYRKDGTSIYPIITLCSESIKKQFPSDPNFEGTDAAAYDRSWRAVRRGYIGSFPTYTSFNKLSLVDEYYFLRKYFHWVWSLYTLIIRIVLMHNIIDEIKAWRASKKKINYDKIAATVVYDGLKDFQSNLVESKPLVSVVIPTLNRYEHLANILKDLEAQDYTHFEVIVVDQSDSFDSKFYNQFRLNINLIRQKEKALWLARNKAINNAKGSIIALSEDDVRISPDWITKHLICLDFFDADISAGVFFPQGSTIPEDRSFYAIASQFATGNAAIQKNVFQETGLFDRQFEKQRMGDGEFGLRAHLLGFKSISNPDAFCLDVKAPEGGLREMGSWDSFRPKNFLSARPIPSVLYFYRKYFGFKRSVLALIKTVPPSIIPYKYRKDRYSMVLGSLISIILLPLILLQVFISWIKSGKKLRKGAIISEYK